MLRYTVLLLSFSLSTAIYPFSLSKSLKENADLIGGAALGLITGTAIKLFFAEPTDTQVYNSAKKEHEKIMKQFTNPFSIKEQIFKLRTERDFRDFDCASTLEELSDWYYAKRSFLKKYEKLQSRSQENTDPTKQRLKNAMKNRIAKMAYTLHDLEEMYKVQSRYTAYMKDFKTYRDLDRLYTKAVIALDSNVSLIELMGYKSVSLAYYKLAERLNDNLYTLRKLLARVPQEYSLLYADLHNLLNHMTNILETMLGHSYYQAGRAEWQHIQYLEEQKRFREEQLRLQRKHIEERRVWDQPSCQCKINVTISPESKPQEVSQPKVEIKAEIKKPQQTDLKAEYDELAKAGEQFADAFNKMNETLKSKTE